MLISSSLFAVMRALIFDWETTGLTLHPDAKPHLQPRAIEFGGLVVERGEVVEEHSWLINPETDLEPIITQITGLTDDDLRDQPTFAECLPKLSRVFGSCDLMIAHNLPFDEAITRYEARRVGYEGFPFPVRGLCTVQAYQEAWGRRPKLVQLYEHVLGRPLAQSHRALDDCRALAEIVLWERLIDDFLEVA